MNARRGAGGGQAGFTLLELLIAITVLGLLTALLSGGLGFGARVWERERRQLDQWSELQTVQEMLRRILSQAIPLAQQGETQGAGSGSFVGTDSSLEFLGPPPAQSLAGGIYKYSLAVRVETSGLRLVLHWQRRTPDGIQAQRPVGNTAPEGAQRLQGGGEVLVIDRIAGAQFSYFGGSEEGSRPRWRDRWQDEAKTPLLVRLQVSFPPGDRRLWPELVVAPQLTATISGG